MGAVLTTESVGAEPSVGRHLAEGNQPCFPVGTLNFAYLLSPFFPASITGSAVCAFYMDDIEKAFSGKFKEQRNSESVWTPVPDEQVPKPR